MCSQVHRLSDRYGKLFGRIVWMLVLVSITLLVVKQHQHTGYFNWRSKLWADQAGYYVYLPSLFIYGFDGNRMPDDIVEKTGEGFKIDQNGKIITRYSAGVAILQAPFFLIIHSLSGITGKAQDGFSDLYHLVSSLAAIFYAFIGIILLYYFLCGYFPKRVVIPTLMALFFGTNLLYYTIDATGMSHIYSFFLFCALLRASDLYFNSPACSRRKSATFIVLAFTSALIVLVRPTNLVFVILVFLLGNDSLQSLKLKLKQVFTLVRIGKAAVAFAIVFLPQMIYWKYSSGSFITDSYAGYGFSNLASPQIVKFLFSPNNGLFLYNPLYILICIALIVMIRHKQPDGYYIAVAFIGLIYLFSSWFLFSFGCGFGSRNFVEYTAIFALPLGFILHKVIYWKKLQKAAIGMCLILCVAVNLKLTFAYDKCFIGTDWDFREYAYLLKRTSHTGKVLYSGEELLTPDMEFSTGISVPERAEHCANYRRAFISLSVRLYDPNTLASVVIDVQHADSIIYWSSFPLRIEYDFKREGDSQKVKADFELPTYYPANSVISAFVWNMEKDSLSISNFKLRLK